MCAATKLELKIAKRSGSRGAAERGPVDTQTLLFQNPSTGFPRVSFRQSISAGVAIPSTCRLLQKYSCGRNSSNKLWLTNLRGVSFAIHLTLTEEAVAVNESFPCFHTYNNNMII